MTTKLHARQIFSRDTLARLYPNVTPQELDDLLRSINAEVTPVFELKAQNPISYVVDVGTSFVQNTISNYYKAAPPIKSGLPKLTTSGTITFPNVDGGNIVASPGNTITLNCPAGNFTPILVSVTKDNQLFISQGASATSVAAARDNVPKVKAGQLPIGVIICRNVSGTIQQISSSDIYQFGAGGGGGGGLTAVDLIAGENLSANTPVYISIGAADGGRTAGRIYRVDASNDNRMLFIGFTQDAVTAGNEVTVITGGILEGFTGLSVGKEVYIDPATIGGLTQTEPENTIFDNRWVIYTGVAVSADTILINPDLAASAYFKIGETSSFNIANNVTSATDITGLVFPVADYRAAIIDYYIYRSTTTNGLAQNGEIRIAYNAYTASWSLSDTYMGDNAGVTFSITSGGQIRYTSTNITGSSYSGIMKWEVRKTFEP